MPSQSVLIDPVKPDSCGCFLGSDQALHKFLRKQYNVTVCSLNNSVSEVRNKTCATQVIAKRPEHSQILQHMREVLHWLPAAKSISFRIILLARATLVNTVLAYVVALCYPWRHADATILYFNSDLVIPSHV